MLLNPLKDLVSLFYPNLCSCCESHLTQNEELICVLCLHDLPFANFSETHKNPVKELFHGRAPISGASSLFLFRKEGKAQKLIHELKYNGKEEIGGFLGKLLGYKLQKNPLFENIDFIVPVPIHPKRLKERGYNQLDLFAKELSKILDIPYSDNILIKDNPSQTQTKKTRVDRWENAKKSFRMTNTKSYENCHILLIDDVITTGATIEACCNELLKAKGIQISIACIGYTE